MTYNNNPPVIRDLTVVLPTIGRPLLRGCLLSIAEGTTWPSELIIVEQGSSDAVASLIEHLKDRGMIVRHLCFDQTGTAAATNRGLEKVQTPFVAVTHDDCRVAPDWLRKIAERVHQAPRAIVTGMVMPEIGQVVPSVITVPNEIVYRRPLLNRDPLFPANMAFSLSILREIGSFDEQSPLPQAEDAEWSYRALRSGIAIIYAPEVKVHHVAWRNEAERAVTYGKYVRSLGGFYGVYIKKGDIFILARCLYDCLRGPWILFRSWVRNDPELTRIGSAYVAHLIPGVISGLRFKAPK